MDNKLAVALAVSHLFCHTTGYYLRRFHWNKTFRKCAHSFVLRTRKVSYEDNFGRSAGIQVALYYVITTG